MNTDDLMVGTTAIHNLGDISRDEPDFLVVTGETESDYIGHWLEGFGFIGVRFPKATTRPLTSAEREQLAREELRLA